MSVSIDLPPFIVNHLHDVATSQGFTDYAVKHEAASKRGDGFMGDMLGVSLVGHRLSATGEKEPHQLHLIVKREPADRLRQQQFCSAWVFEREVHMYNRVLPIFERLQRERGLNETNGFFSFPKCYLAKFDADNESESIIILEDLRVSGFSMWDKTKVAPFENVRLLLEQMGRLHALSFVLRDQQPDVLAALVSELRDLVGPIIRAKGFVPLFKSAYGRAAKLMEKEAHAELFDRINERWVEMFDASFDTSRYDRFAVISHGDCWINNMMFEHKDGIGQRISILDWQISALRSPASDIANFLFTVTDSASRAKYMDTYLDIYYTNVATTIRAFGSDPERLFSRADFDQQMRENAYYAILNGAMSLPCTVCQPGDVSDMNVLAGNAERGETDEAHMFAMDDRTEVLYRQRYCSVVEDADRYGWVDVMRKL